MSKGTGYRAVDPPQLSVPHRGEGKKPHELLLWLSVPEPDKL